MSKTLSITDVYTLFKSHGFTEIKDISTGNGVAYYTETQELCIGIFDRNYPNTGYCGKILAEHKDNFDKWSSAFYTSDFPGNEEQFKIILQDFHNISNEENKKSGDSFGHLTREF